MLFSERMGKAGCFERCASTTSSHRLVFFYTKSMSQLGLVLVLDFLVNIFLSQLVSKEVSKTKKPTKVQDHLVKNERFPCPQDPCMVYIYLHECFFLMVN